MTGSLNKITEDQLLWNGSFVGEIISPLLVIGRNNQVEFNKCIFIWRGRDSFEESI